MRCKVFVRLIALAWISAVGWLTCLALQPGCTSAPTNEPTSSPTPQPSTSPSPTASPTPLPTASPSPQLPADQPRVAYQSACAQNTLACESSRPLPVLEIEPGENQFVTISDAGIVITGESADGFETVRLVGSRSVPGTGFDEVTYSWSYGATDPDPDTLAPGFVFSQDAELTVGMAEGFHYIRLTVHNGSDPVPAVPLPDDLNTEFRERQIEIRITPSDDHAPRVRR